MQVVAATRLRRAQAAVQATRPYAEKMLEVLQTAGERATEYKHPFLVRREGTRAVMILVTTDKGLAGAINVNSIRAGTRYMQEHYPDQPKYVTLGRKGRDFLLRFRRNVIADTSGLPRSEEHTSELQSRQYLVCRLLLEKKKKKKKKNKEYTEHKIKEVRH